MTWKTILTAAGCIWTLTAVPACESTDAPEPTERGLAERDAIGKADLFGSCAAQHPASFCGHRSPGSCWCDSYCELFGDCCDDYQQTCLEVTCGPGEVTCEDCAGETACWEATTEGGCPDLACPPCDEQQAECVACDGQHYCIDLETNDACPILACPPPTD